MAEAAEKRLRQEEARGMKDPEGYKRKVEQREKLEANLASSSNDAPLKVFPDGLRKMNMIIKFTVSVASQLKPDRPLEYHLIRN